METILILVVACLLLYFFGLQRSSIQSFFTPNILITAASGFAAEWIFRGGAFAMISRDSGAGFAIVLTSLLWMAITNHTTGFSVAFVGATNLAYGIIRARGERTFWIGIVHGVVSGFSLLPVHFLGGL